jgi:hypothetical protein
LNMFSVKQNLFMLEVKLNLFMLELESGATEAGAAAGIDVCVWSFF